MPGYPEHRQDTAPLNCSQPRSCVFCPSDDLITCRLRLAFASSSTKDSRLTYHEFGSVVQACGLGHFWRRPLFNLGLDIGKCCLIGHEGGGDDCPSVGCDSFVSRWLGLKRLSELGHMLHRCFDSVTLFVSLVGRGLKDRLSADDLLPWVEDVADRALALQDSYLKEPYVDTVLARLLLRYGSHLTGVLTPSSLKVSGFSHLLDRLCNCTYPIRRDNEMVPDYTEDLADDLPDEFSYDDFLAIFGLYWELTARQKSLHSIRQGDLYAYAPLSKRFLAEAFKIPCVRPFSISGTELSYPDFVWLIVSAEGKGCWPQSAEFLFRVLDLESDGVLTPDELHYFFQEQDGNSSRRSFQDVMCELVDAVRPCDPSRFTLLDLRRSGVAHVFFSPFVDAPEYQRRWNMHRRKSANATWSSTDPSHCLACWESFVQERLDHMRYAEELLPVPNNETSRKKHKKRHSKTRHRAAKN